MEKIKKIIEAKSFHILLIILGSVLILSSAFFTELWYDESYTMGLVRHDFAQIVEIGSQDVHPILYYLMLKVFMVILGDSILVARLFSMIPAILTGILGYTHIRKDFGNKVGLLFSFLILTLPIMPSYGAEIRMYTWTLFFATVSAIYAYRIAKDNKVKNWSLFAIFSLATAHCHYYGLVTVAIINALLLFHIIFTKNEEIRNTRRSYFIRFLITAIVQILGYLPWLFIFFTQARTVSQGFWIPLNFRDSVLAPLAVQFHGVIGVDFSFLVAGIIYVYYIYQMIWNKLHKRKNTVVIYCLAVHLILYLSMLLVSIVVKPIMYYRYMVVTTGILIFPLAYFLSNSSTKIQKGIATFLVIAFLGLSIYDNSVRIKENYDISNGTEIQYIQEQYNENTILLYTDIFLASSLAEQLPEYHWCYYLGDDTVEVKPFEISTRAVNSEFLDEYHGKIILIDSEETATCQDMTNRYQLKEIERKRIQIKYRGIIYHIIILEK